METIPDKSSNDDDTDGAINMEFENNPNLEKSNYRFKFRHSKLLILTLNLYSIQYISNRVLAALKSTISQADIQKQPFQPDAVSSVVFAAWVAGRSLSTVPTRWNSADLLVALQSENISFFRHRNRYRRNPGNRSDRKCRLDE